MPEPTLRTEKPIAELLSTMKSSLNCSNCSAQQRGFGLTRATRLRGSLKSWAGEASNESVWSG